MAGYGKNNIISMGTGHILLCYCRGERMFKMSVHEVNSIECMNVY